MNAAVDLENVIKNLEGREDDSEQRPTGLFARALAQAFDGIIFTYLFFLLANYLFGNRTDLDTFSMADADWGSFVLNFLFPIVYTLGFWILFQATPGKMIINCQIVDVDTGDKPSIMQLIIRLVVFALCLVLPMFGFTILMAGFAVGGGLSLMGVALTAPILGLLMIPFNEYKQGLHDKLARTAVVY